MRFTASTYVMTFCAAVVLFSAAPTRAEETEKGMGGFFAAMGKQDASEMSGKKYSRDELYAMSVAGLKLGMEPEAAAKILEEKGYVGQVFANGLGKYENPIDKLLVTFSTLPRLDDGVDVLSRISFQQTWDTPQDAPTWKEKIKKRYGEEPTREEEFFLFYTDVPLLKTGLRVASDCQNKDIPECNNISHNPGILMEVSWPHSLRMEIDIQDWRAYTEYNAAKEKEEEDARKEEASTAKENF